MATILLIEDNLDTARMVRKLLTPLGHEIVHATHGLDGMQLARQTRPDLMLVDINLPDISGNVVILQLRASACHLTAPIIAFTAECGPKAKRIAAAMGCDGFISKPIDPRLFPGEVDSYIKVAQRV